MQIFEDTFTHLGSSLEETLQMIDFLKGKCNNYGIAFYIQNNLKQKENVLESIFNYILKKCNHLGLKFINVGGISHQTKCCEEALIKAKADLNLEEIVLEVGRDLVQDTMEIETRIIREKMINNQKIIIIKNGLYSGFFDVILYNKKFDIYLKTKDNTEIKLEYEKAKQNDCEIVLCGGSSDSGDKLGVFYIDSKYKDELSVETNMVVKNVGAYFEEFFMAYGNDLNKVIIKE
jgi:diaminopimelate decarboxylase